MSEQRYTPGPWKVIRPGHGHPSEYMCVQYGADDRYTSLEMLPADARLTAAAPDLFEAANAVLNHFMPQFPSNWVCACGQRPGEGGVWRGGNVWAHQHSSGGWSEAYWAPQNGNP